MTMPAELQINQAEGGGDLTFKSIQTFFLVLF